MEYDIGVRLDNIMASNEEIKSKLDFLIAELQKAEKKAKKKKEVFDGDE